MKALGNVPRGQLVFCTAQKSAESARQVTDATADAAGPSSAASSDAASWRVPRNSLLRSQGIEIATECKWRGTVVYCNWLVIH